MNDILERWKRAAVRAAEENVRVVHVGDEYRAASTSQLLRSYVLRPSPSGWTCECMANSEYGMPCKHLSALADALGLDVLADMYIAWDVLLPVQAA